jgi:hypothetical protein
LLDARERHGRRRVVDEVGRTQEAPLFARRPEEHERPIERRSARDAVHHGEQRRGAGRVVVCAGKDTLRLFAEMIEMSRDEDDLVFVRTVAREKPDDVVRRLRGSGRLDVGSRIDGAVQDSGRTRFTRSGERVAELLAHLFARLRRDRSGQKDPVFEEVGPELDVFLFHRRGRHRKPTDRERLEEGSALERADEAGPSAARDDVIGRFLQTWRRRASTFRLRPRDEHQMLDGIRSVALLQL